MTENKPADGSTIVGVFDRVGQGLGQPNDVLALNGINALLTTTMDQIGATYGVTQSLGSARGRELSHRCRHSAGHRFYNFH